MVGISVGISLFLGISLLPTYMFDAINKRKHMIPHVRSFILLFPYDNSLTIRIVKITDSVNIFCHVTSIDCIHNRI